LEIRFHKRQVSFLMVKTVKCRRGIKHILCCSLFSTSMNLSNFYSNIVVFFDAIKLLYCRSYRSGRSKLKSSEKTGRNLLLAY